MTCHSKVVLSDVVPFSERRNALILWIKKENLSLEKRRFKRGYAYFISIFMLKKILKSYDLIPLRQKNKNSCLYKAFKDIEKYLKDKKCMSM